MGVAPIVLVVDDKPNMLRLLKKVLGGDATVCTAERGAEAIDILRSQPVAVVLSDLKLPDVDGIEVLRACRTYRPDAEFILMTAYASLSTAVEALRLGAYDYLTKPFEPEDVRAVVRRALGRAAPRPSAAVADPEVELLPGIYGRSAPMRALAALVRRVAATDATALLLGETGTGKERIARALHALGPRATHRFVAVNCAAIPNELLESELFGFARGAFSGAARDRAGLFEEAHGGTIFLDEIGDLRPSLQAKLTRAIEERAVRRLGESRERTVDVRIVAATHRDLEAMVKDGAFREDLWYRLKVAVIDVPPLREHREDVDVLATRFLRDLCESSPGRDIAGFTEEALDAMRRYHWPGNVRQLRSAVESASIVATGRLLDVGDLPHEVTRPDAPATGDIAALNWQDAVERAKDDAARRYLQAVLTRFGGRVGEAAAHAGVERESFYRLMRRHGVKPDGSLRSPGEDEDG